ncbi:GDSL-type esterase/lipase family protein [Candidatus Uabimicrobium sp. HlEnr_7]|uniref:GDSL-type esterase/lipase family protein n=1 Tax=Candidatus Uabimicrobium helgolandensis TaxID=3095367 RepID=UPI003558544A
MKIIIIVFIVIFMTTGFAQDNYYEKTIQQFEAKDKKSFPPQNAVLFVGSSSIRLWGSLKDDFPEIATINRGFGGSQTSDVVYFVDRIVTLYKPKAIVFYCGENDIAAKKAVEVPIEDFKKFVIHVRKHLPKTLIYYVSMKPSPSRKNIWPKMVQANQKIAEYCKENSVVDGHKNLGYIDISAVMLQNNKIDKSIFVKDMLHMNADGYAKWTSVIRKRLVKDGLLVEKEEK